VTATQIRNLYRLLLGQSIQGPWDGRGM